MSGWLIALIAVGGLLLLLLVLLFCGVARLRIRCRDEVQVFAGVLGLRFRLYPQKEPDTTPRGFFLNDFWNSGPAGATSSRQVWDACTDRGMPCAYRARWQIWDNSAGNEGRLRTPALSRREGRRASQSPPWGSA